jgi:DNA-binding response OmpR family regulator
MLPVRILFVDDEPAILLTLSTILGQKGFEVITASSPDFKGAYRGNVDTATGMLVGSPRVS